jgi:protein-S-isoprenylcysteine O-methyltransferase Ste14
MKCKSCGTEIADKALICYRCGQATFEPQRQPPAAAARRPGSVISTLALIVLVLAALFMGQVTTEPVPDVVRWTMAALAVVILAWRIVSRRRRLGRR